MNKTIVTIDGGAASGKSSTSRALAERLNLLHVDTGSFYRSLTWALIEQECDPDNIEQVKEKLEGIVLGTSVVSRSSKILINNKPLTDASIRSEIVNKNVSKFASIPEVREKLLNYQRSYAHQYESKGFAGIVMEGRDIGSVVFPEAPFRFYLFADEATRQARRAKEGQVDSIKKRDAMDQNRKTAPLKVPEGAVSVDTSHLTLDEVVDKLEAMISGAQ